MKKGKISKNIYIIYSSDRITTEKKERINAHIEEMESAGHDVRLPCCDTGLVNAVTECEKDILWANEIHVWWDPDPEFGYWDKSVIEMLDKIPDDKKVVQVNNGLEEIFNYMFTALRTDPFSLLM